MGCESSLPCLCTIEMSIIDSGNSVPHAKTQTHLSSKSHSSISPNLYEGICKVSELLDNYSQKAHKAGG